MLNGGGRKQELEITVLHPHPLLGPSELSVCWLHQHYFFRYAVVMTLEYYEGPFLDLNVLQNQRAYGTDQALSLFQHKVE